MRFCLSFLIFFLWGNLSLFAQYSSFELGTSSSGLGGQGAGLSDRETSLGANPSFLAGTGSQVQGGLLFFTLNNKSSPIQASPTGFYYNLDSDSGWGMRFRSGFMGQFPANTKLTHYESDLFFSKKWNHFFFSVGIGPRLGFRGREQSRWSLGGFLGLGLQINDWTLGLFGSISGKYAYEEYRGSDPLEERLPNYLFFGLRHKLGENWAFYGEIGRIFYEYSRFRLSDSESKPNLDRGLGADLDTNLGLEYAPHTEMRIRIRTGFGFAGKFNPEGQNKRGLALSLGLRFFPFAQEDFFLNFHLLNHSIFSKSGNILPENVYSFSGGYLW